MKRSILCITVLFLALSFVLCVPRSKAEEKMGTVTVTIKNFEELKKKEPSEVKFVFKEVNSKSVYSFERELSSVQETNSFSLPYGIYQATQSCDGYGDFEENHFTITQKEPCAEVVTDTSDVSISDHEGSDCEILEDSDCEENKIDNKRDSHLHDTAQYVPLLKKILPLTLTFG